MVASAPRATCASRGGRNAGPRTGVIYHGAASGSVCRGGQAQMGEGELVLVGTGGGHRDLDAADADPHQRANLEQLEGIVPQVASANWVCRKATRRRAQTSTYAIAANHSRNWLARMVVAEVRSANRSSWHSLMRFSMSPRAQ